MDLPSQLIRFSLALWVGGTLLVVIAAPVVFGEVPSRDRAGAVFGEILRRFIVTFDYPHTRILLEPNSSFTNPKQ